MSAHFFGLDIGRSFIKVVQVAKSGSNLMLTAAASVPTPKRGLLSELPEDLNMLAAAIKNCVKSAGVEDDKCSVSLVESQVVTRVIQMPSLTDKELSAAINWEADRYIPFPIKDVNLQYQVISRKSAEAGGEMDVLLVAAPKRVTEKYLKVISLAGFSVFAMETEASSLARALVKRGDPATIIISIGGDSTVMVMVRDGNVIFTRSLATGGANLTKALMTEFKLPEDQAEEYKRAYGILKDKLGGKVANVLKPILETVVVEVIKVLDYSRNHIEGYQLNRIIICGGGSYLPGFAEYLTERTSLKVLSGDPWASFSKEGLVLKIPGQGGFFAVATGLALRS
jgi:type IV pilus assembly protein PilM